MQKIKRSKKIEKTPEYVRQIGDGKLPNKYWVTVSDDFYVLKKHSMKAASESGNKQFKKQIKGIFRTIGPFDSYAKALKIAQEEYVDKNSNVRMVQIEDRITGQVYEDYLVAYHDKWGGWEFNNEQHENLSFTKKKLGSKFK